MDRTATTASGNRTAQVGCPVTGLLVPAAQPSFLDIETIASLPETCQVGRVVRPGRFVQLVVPEQVNPMIDRFLELPPTGGRD